MNNWELPTNIRQIGSLDGDAGFIKIYMEDYVCTYLRQYAESGGVTEKIAFLVGKYMIIDGHPYVFINGVVQGKHSEYADNMESFTDASYDHAREEIGKYFDGCEIVGWMQSQPGYGVHLNPAYADYHMNSFTRPYQLLFVMDPIEKLNLFYAWNPEMTGIGEVGGYFIYYDQNKGMQDYMNANRISRKGREAEKPAATAETPTTRLKIFGDGDKKQEARPAGAASPRRGRSPMGGMRVRGVENAEKRLGPKTEGKTLDDMRKLSNLLIGLCAVLFITVFIMGAGLLQSDSRISALESAIVTMDGNYVVIAEQMRALAALPAFAEHNQPGTAYGVGQTQVQPQTPPEPTPTPTPAMTPTPTPAPEPEQPPEPPQNDDDDDEPSAHVFANLPEYHIIQPGDSLLAISRMFYGNTTMVSRIMEINGIVNPDHIVVGQRVYLPRN